VIRMQNSRYTLLVCALLACAAAHAQSVGQSQIGEVVERQLPADQPFSKWVRDLNQIETDAGDQFEKQMVARDGFETVKLRNVVPPVRFDSGGTAAMSMTRRVYPGVLTLAMFCPVTSSPKRWASSARAAAVRLLNRLDIEGSLHACVECLAGV